MNGTGLKLRLQFCSEASFSRPLFLFDLDSVDASWTWRVHSFIQHMPICPWALQLHLPTWHSPDIHLTFTWPSPDTAPHSVWLLLDTNAAAPVRCWRFLNLFRSSPGLERGPWAWHRPYFRVLSEVYYINSIYKNWQYWRDSPAAFIAKRLS